MDHDALRSCHAIMYKFVTSMVHCGLGMQQCTMDNATIQKTTFFELGVYMYIYIYVVLKQSAVAHRVFLSLKLHKGFVFA